MDYKTDGFRPSNLNTGYTNKFQVKRDALTRNLKPISPRGLRAFGAEDLSLAPSASGRAQAFSSAITGSVQV